MVTKDFTKCPQYDNCSCNLNYVRCDSKSLCCFHCKTKGCKWRCVTTDGMSDIEKNFRRHHG